MTGGQFVAGILVKLFFELGPFLEALPVGSSAPRSGFARLFHGVVRPLDSGRLVLDRGHAFMSGGGTRSVRRSG